MLPGVACAVCGFGWFWVPLYLGIVKGWFCEWKWYLFLGQFINWVWGFGGLGFEGVPLSCGMRGVHVV